MSFHKFKKYCTICVSWHDLYVEIIMQVLTNTIFVVMKVTKKYIVYWPDFILVLDNTELDCSVNKTHHSWTSYYMLLRNWQIGKLKILNETWKQSSNIHKKSTQNLQSNLEDYVHSAVHLSTYLSFFCLSIFSVWIMSSVWIPILGV